MCLPRERGAKRNRDNFWSVGKLRQTATGSSYILINNKRTMENKQDLNPSAPSAADDVKDDNCRPDSQCPDQANNMTEEEQSDVKPLQNLVLSKAYRPVAAKILQQLDPESFLACRLVCKDWREMVNLHHPKWKEINQADIGFAASRGDKLLVELLINKGQDVNLMTSPFRGTPLCQASNNGHVDTVRVLLSAGADVNNYSGWCGTALHYSSRSGHLEVAEVLLSAGADVNATRAQCGQTALHLASGRGHVGVVKALLSAGADVNFKDSSLQTPLHVSSTEGRVEVVKVLLENGADIYSKDKCGISALINPHFNWSGGPKHVKDEIIRLLNAKKIELEGHEDQ